ncbi:OmpL47-type beta-barrel domain-containing protein [Rarobacter incanus]|uniref:OmpL47-type beta-barrel domain-containing protein n=1 Tax=Rarobacter incanus TaxID=153494 RepID=UPI001151F975|nr:Ig-like domain repeat protein [Rarobacter incanus]
MHKRRLIAALTTAALTATALTAAVPAHAAASGADPMAANPFGGNVTIFDSSWSNQNINTALRNAASAGTHWSTDRKAFFFKPGTYGNSSYNGATDDPTKIVNSEVGYYTQISGLGKNPGDVTINGALHVEGEQYNAGTTYSGLTAAEVQKCSEQPWGAGNDSNYIETLTPEEYASLSKCLSPGGLNNFWRSLSNMTINPKQFAYGDDAARGTTAAGNADAGQMRWAVSQAAPMRRVQINGDLSVYPHWGQYSSGGFIADSKIQGSIQTGSQQQFLFRNSAVNTQNDTSKQFDDKGVWNMVFSGVTGGPSATDFPTSTSNDTTDVSTLHKWTVVDKTSVSREAPYVVWDSSSGYSVVVPDAQKNTSGTTWSASANGSSQTISLSKFLVANKDTSIDDINAWLETPGNHLILSPDVYKLSHSIVIKNANTVVLGLGLATLTPVGNADAVIKVADVEGVKIAGILVDAGERLTNSLIKVGPVREGDTADNSNPDNPTTLSDVFVRVGGMNKGRTDTAIEINSDNVLLDDIWTWRADHGTGDSTSGTGLYGWSDNYAPTGVRVNGDSVHATGLFAEHFYKNQVEWNGNNGDVVFFQSELPYEVPNQSKYKDEGRDGYASYRVAPDVTDHRLRGAGVYSYFRDAQDNPSASTGISVPRAENVTVTSAVTRFLNGYGSIDHVVNRIGRKAANVDLTANGKVNDNDRTSWLANFDWNSDSDSIAPVILTDADPASPDDGDTYTTPVNLWVSATDNETPNDQILLEYQIDDRNWKRVGINADTGKGLLNPPSGEHTVKLRATDEAGNVSRTSRTFKINADGNPGDLTDPESGTDPDIGGPVYPVDPDPTDPDPADTTKPTVQITSDPQAATDGVFRQQVTLTITAKDNVTTNAGYPKVTYKINGGATTDYSAPFKLTDDGTYTVLARATDKQGNWREATWTGKIDTSLPDAEAPKVTISSDPSSPSANGKYETSVKLTVTASDDKDPSPSIEVMRDGGEWEAYTGPVTFTSEGEHSLQARATDSAGKVSDVKTWTGTIRFPDATSPSATITPDRAPDANGKYTNAVTLTVAGSDDSGAVAKLEYDLGNGWVEYSTPITLTNNGTYTVKARATDAAGNVSEVAQWTGTIAKPASDPWNLGSNPPGTITVGKTLTATIHTKPAAPKKGYTWFKKNVTVKVTGTAPAGTRAVAQIKVGNGPWYTYAGPVLVSANGKTQIQARTVTMTKSSPVVSKSVKVDKVKPKKIKVKIKIKKKKRVAYIRLTATDKHSKVLKFRYKLPGKKWKTITAKKAKKKGIVLKAKKKKIAKIVRKLVKKKAKLRVYAIDKAGNASKKGKKSKVKIAKKLKKRLAKVV